MSRSGTRTAALRAQRTYMSRDLYHPLSRDFTLKEQLRGNSGSVKPAQHSHRKASQALSICNACNIFNPLTTANSGLQKVYVFECIARRGNIPAYFLPHGKCECIPATRVQIQKLVLFLFLPYERALCLACAWAPPRRICFRKVQSHGLCARHAITVSMRMKPANMVFVIQYHSPPHMP